MRQQEDRGTIMPRNYFMTTARLGFSRWEETDLPLARQLWGEEAVSRYICAAGRFTEEDIEARLKKEIENGSAFGIQYWPVFLRETGELAGCCGLRPYREGQPEFGIHLREKFWHRGLAGEAGNAVIGLALGDEERMLKAGAKIDPSFWEDGTQGASCLTKPLAGSLFAGHNPCNKASRKLLTGLGFVYLRDEFYAPTGLYHPSYELKKTE